MPQLSYSQNAIIAQPGMVFDGDIFYQDRVSRIASQVLPFGALVEFDSNGNAQLVQDATTLAGTVTVANGSAAITFSTAQTLSAGTLIYFSDQPSVTYQLAANVAAATSGTLTVLYSGTGGSGKTASIPFSPASIGVVIFDPMGEEENYTPWSVPVTLAGTVSTTNGSTAITFSTAQTLTAGTMLIFSGGTYSVGVSQTGVPYFLATSITASTSGTLTLAFGGTATGLSVTSQGAGATCPGYKIGRSVPILRHGRIWVLGDGGGTYGTNGGTINVHHSSTGLNPQGVFTFSAASQTSGNEIDVAPGVKLFSPNNGPPATGPASVTDSFGNVFFIYPVQIGV